MERQVIFRDTRNSKLRITPIFRIHPSVDRPSVNDAVNCVAALLPASTAPRRRSRGDGAARSLLDQGGAIYVGLPVSCSRSLPFAAVASAS